VTDVAAQPQPTGWVLLPPAAVPEAWQDRGAVVVLVPLLEGELAPLLAAARAPAQLQVSQLVQLVARGLPKREIARQLSVSVSTMDRQLRRLRDEVGVRTFSELAAELARRGFGS
jgi:DNA-binding CsgD family transcriptional regulator